MTTNSTFFDAKVARRMEPDLYNAQIDWKVISTPRRLALGMPATSGNCGRGNEDNRKRKSRAKS